MLFSIKRNAIGMHVTLFYMKEAGTLKQIWTPHTGSKQNLKQKKYIPIYGIVISTK